MLRTFISLAVYLLLLGLSALNAQPANDDPTNWIKYRQTYLKIPIVENGLYRVTATELGQAGVPVDQLDPTTLQLFHRGIEQAIFVANETTNRLGTGGFLEFYGRGNDGTPDSALYRPATAQPHPYFSLFNDTTAYFLTWRLDGQPSKRMAAYTDTTSANLTPDAWHWANELRLFTADYPGWAAGLSDKIEYSHYEAGEGYTGVLQQKEKPFHSVFQLTDPVRNGPDLQLDVLLVGRDYLNHRVDCLVGTTPNTQHVADSVCFTGYANARIQSTTNWTDVGTNSQVVVSTVSRGEFTSTDAYSVSYIRLRYPQKFRANGQASVLFQLQKNPIGRSLVPIAAVQPNTRFWDIIDPNALISIGATTLTSDSVQLVVRGTDTPRMVLAVSQPKRVPALKPVTFTEWTNRKPTYLIISHEALMQPINGQPNAVRVYAAYRASAAGGNHDTLTATMSQLFDQYSYGERHPLAIRRFAAQMLRQTNGVAPYLLLLGRGRSTPGIRRDPQQSMLDLVMTAGFPGSDGVFTAGLANAEPDVPAMPTGRINAGTPQEILDYLNKVKEYEKPGNKGPWRKNLLHLSGGRSSNERVLFRQLVDSYQQQAVGQSLGARVTTISKMTDMLVEPLNVAKPVNDGVGLITFFGHSGLDVTDLDIGFCSSDVLGYRNAGRYPVLFINGCAIGNFFFGRPTLTTDWVLTPNRGAIAAIAQSHLGYVDVMHVYTTIFYNLLTDSTQRHKSIGQLQQETIRRVLAQTPDGRTLANAQQMVLQGDPAVVYQLRFQVIDKRQLTQLRVYPNPLRDQTLFSFTLTGDQAPESVSILITDLTGRVVRHLTQPARIGLNEWLWDGRSDAGTALPAGLYIYKIRLDETTWSVADSLTSQLSGRLILLR